MWQKVLVISLLFYILAMLQVSFLSHYNIFGYTPNLVFILFFTSLFFDDKGLNAPNAYLAFSGGFFLDVISGNTFGVSIIGFAIILLLYEKVSSSLLKSGDKHPFYYFVPLFLIFITMYKAIVDFEWGSVTYLIYNLVLASLFFYIFKKMADVKNLQS